MNATNAALRQASFHTSPRIKRTRRRKSPMIPLRGGAGRLALRAGLRFLEADLAAPLEGAPYRFSATSGRLVPPRPFVDFAMYSPARPICFDHHTAIPPHLHAEESGRFGQIIA